MKVTKLNGRHNVFTAGNAKWQLVFETDKGYAKMIIKLAEAFGLGMPYTNHPTQDAGHPWMFRNASVSAYSEAHIIYITTEEQLTFCQLLGGSGD